MLSTIIFSAVILIFNLLFFVIGGTAHPISVWIAYGAIHLAYLFAAGSPWMVKNDKHRLENSTPLIGVATLNFALQLIVGIIIILISPSTHKATLTIEIILLVIFFAALLSFAHINFSTTAATARQTKEVYFIRDLASRVKFLIGRYMDGKLDKRLEKLYDTLFSSPTRSCKEAKQFESELQLKIGELEAAVCAGKEDEASNLIDDSMLLIEKIRYTIRNHQ